MPLTAASWLSYTRAGPWKTRAALVHPRRLHDANRPAPGRPSAPPGRHPGRRRGRASRITPPWRSHVQVVVATRLGEGGLGGHATRRGAVGSRAPSRCWSGPRPTARAPGPRSANGTVGSSVCKQPCPAKLAQDGHDPAGAVHVLHVHVGLGGGDLAQAGRAARQPVDVVHAEVDLRLMSGGQQVQHGVGRAAHGDVQGHGVFERAEAGHRARQHAGVVLLVPAPG